MTLDEMAGLVGSLSTSYSTLQDAFNAAEQVINALSSTSSAVTEAVTGLQDSVQALGNQVSLITVPGNEEIFEAIKGDISAVIDSRLANFSVDDLWGFYDTMNQNVNVINATIQTVSQSADGAEAAAYYAQLLGARAIQGGNLILNPTFAEWPEGDVYPTHWTDTNTPPNGSVIRNTTNTKYSPYCLQFDAAVDEDFLLSLEESGGIPTGIVSNESEYLVVDAEVELLSGAIDGAGLGIAWTNTTDTDFYAEDVTLWQAISAWRQAGSVYQISRVIRRDPAWTGTFKKYQVHLSANNASYGTRAAKQLIWHYVRLRPATDEEIRTFNVDGEISAAVAVEASARASAIDGVEAKYSVKVDVNGYVTGYGLIATDNDGTPTSEMTFLVDKFKIAAPGVGPRNMFTVGTINGVTTVGIYGNLIVDGTITASSAVSTGSVVTDNMANNSISKTTYAEDTALVNGQYYGYGYSTMIGVIANGLSNAPRLVKATAVFTHYAVLTDTTVTFNLIARLKRNGVVISIETVPIYLQVISTAYNAKTGQYSYTYGFHLMFFMQTIDYGGTSDYYSFDFGTDYNNYIVSSKKKTIEVVELKR